MNGTPLSLTMATLKEMGSQFRHVIHSMLIKDYMQRGPSIPCHPLLMCTESLPMAISSSTQACKHQIKSEISDFDNYRHYFGWVNVDTIKETFKHTTQWGASVTTFPMKRHLKSRNPALNIPRRHEAVATDTVYSDTPAVDSGV